MYKPDPEEEESLDVDTLNKKGRMYYYGENVYRDYVEAKKYYEQAANLGSGIACYHLGLIYFYGNSVPVDYQKSKEYYEKAFAYGELEAAKRLAFVLYDKFNDITSAMSVLIQVYQKTKDSHCLKIQHHCSHKVKTEDMLKVFDILLETFHKTRDDGYIEEAITLIETNSILNAFIPKYIDMLVNIKDLTQKVSHLELQNKDLQTQVLYQPDGPGYLEAKQEFESLKDHTS